MAGTEYMPLALPGDELTVTAAAAITGGQVVVYSAADTVTPTSAATELLVGVAAADAPSGATLSIYTEGLHNLVASASIAFGQPVIAAANGAVAPYPSSGGDPATIIGRATEPSTGSSPSTVAVLLG